MSLSGLGVSLGHLDGVLESSCGVSVGLCQRRAGRPPSCPWAVPAPAPGPPTTRPRSYARALGAPWARAEPRQAGDQKIEPWPGGNPEPNSEGTSRQHLAHYSSRVSPCANSQSQASHDSVARTKRKNANPNMQGLAKHLRGACKQFLQKSNDLIWQRARSEMKRK